MKRLLAFGLLGLLASPAAALADTVCDGVNSCGGDAAGGRFLLFALAGLCALALCVSADRPD